MNAEELTPAWLGSVLGHPVASVEAERIGAGLVGTNLRIRITYDGDPPPEVPASVVAKLPSTEEGSRAAGIMFRNYEREVRFYTEVAPTIAMRTPHCFHGERDEATGDFVLLLEDMAGSEPGDQLVGCSVDVAAAALEELARLHAPWWGAARLDQLDWLSGRHEPGSSATLAMLYQSVWPTFVERFGDGLTASQLALGEELGGRFEAWISATPPPFTIVHGDYRLDNLLFGVAPEAPPVTVVDWQTPGKGPGVGDASYFIGNGLVHADRQAAHLDLLRVWHDAVTAGGVDYPWERCVHDYRLGALGGVVMTVIAFTSVTMDERGRRLAETMAERHFAHAEEVEALDLLP